MKRPTRVPASMMVRMNKASNAGPLQILAQSRFLLKSREEEGPLLLFKIAAPLHDLRLGKDISFQLAPDTFLAPIPDWLRNDDFTLKRLSQPDREELAACTHCFLAEYEVDEAAELLASRKEKETYRSAKGIKSDEVYLANFALWLLRFPSVGFNLVFHAQGSSIKQTVRHDRFLCPDDQHHRRKLISEDLKSVQSLYTALCKIPRHSPPWAAFRAVTSGLQMQRIEIRHLLLWIALEALFGVADGEIKYRLSQRLAFFVANDRSEAGELFIKAKQGYDARCKMAHGAWGPKTLNTEKAIALTGITEDFIRRAFIRLLQDEEISKKFCGSAEKRSAYLDQLPFEEFIGHPGTIPAPAQSSEDTDGE